MIVFSPKLDLIFLIINTLIIICFEFKYEIISKVFIKLFIIVINLLICFLIIQISNTKSFIIATFIYLSNIDQISYNAIGFDNNLIKLEKEVRFNKYFLR